MKACVNKNGQLLQLFDDNFNYCSSCGKKLIKWKEILRK